MKRKIRAFALAVILFPTTSHAEWLTSGPATTESEAEQMASENAEKVCSERGAGQTSVIFEKYFAHTEQGVYLKIMYACGVEILYTAHATH